MARGTERQEKEGMPSKFYIYIGSFVIFGFLTFFLWLLGVDFGFVSFEGNISPVASLWIVGIGILFELIVDFRYSRSVRLFMGMDNSILDYIPIVNTVVLMSKVIKIVSIATMSIIVLGILLAFTPVMQLFPVTMLEQVGNFGMLIGIIGVIAFLGLRGWTHLSNKIGLVKIHARLRGEDADEPAIIGVLQTAFYFLPLARMSVLLTDAQFIKTVKMMEDAAAEMEEGVY